MVDRKYRLARLWSNKELRKVAAFFSGDIVNVSAWDDRDKEGNYYKNYFQNARNYYYTNYCGEKGIQSLKNEFFCDLSEDLPSELLNRFDVVFNHTTLEHIFDVKKAFQNICKMSKDIVIIVVPFCQVQHETKDWKDYWRFTPTVIRKLFEENGFKTIFQSANNHKNCAIYLFSIGSKNSEKWSEKFLFSEKEKLNNCGKQIGFSLIEEIKDIVRNIFWTGKNK